MRERVIIAVTAALKDKPDWERKVFDEAIVGKWKLEAMETDSVTQSEGQAVSNEHDHEQQSKAEHTSLDSNEAARQKVVTEKLFQYVRLHDVQWTSTS